MIEAELFEIIEEFPENIRPHMVRLVKILVRHIDEGIRRSDLERLEAKTEEGFQRVWSAIERLTEAQRQSEERLTRVEAAVERLAEAQRRTEEELGRFARNFNIKIGALGARWGCDSEDAFREAVKYVVEEVGFEVERYVAFDKKGIVFGRPEQVEIDIIVRNGEKIVGEI